MTQVLEVFATAGNGFQLFRAIYVVEIGPSAVIAVAVCLQVAVLVAFVARQGDGGQLRSLAAGPEGIPSSRL